MLACGALAMIAAELGALGGVSFDAVSAVDVADVVDVVEANFGREMQHFGELSEYSSE